MANASPAKVTITSTTGPGQAATAAVFTDVVDFEVDFLKNTIKLTRSGSGNNVISYYDYSAMATLTWTISAGAATIAISS